MDELVFDILVAIGSVLAGVIGALIGLGGGVIITPLLVLAFGIDIRYAMGAALCSVIATSSGAAAAYLRDGISNMRIGLFLCVATTIGAVCGAMLAMAPRHRRAFGHLWSSVTGHSSALAKGKKGSVRFRCVGSSRR